MTAVKQGHNGARKPVTLEAHFQAKSKATMLRWDERTVFIATFQRYAETLNLWWRIFCGSKGGDPENAIKYHKTNHLFKFLHNADVFWGGANSLHNKSDASKRSALPVHCMMDVFSENKYQNHDFFLAFFINFCLYKIYLINMNYFIIDIQASIACR